MIISDIALEGSERIYINEHLNPELHPLLKKALSLRQTGKISQVASHSTHISVKLGIDGRSKWFRVKDQNALNTLMGLDQGASEDEI